ncbi:MAG: nucleotidyltransferase domain-containing protein [Candidatus Kapabacteria bacterium]|nr:nucleotidyltransferase domain-containing protein [Ignavibacteriota bacterium]MCW5885651.1 nucleotidyltransferase domain-containing protein [Candidatus Kapabacteria bacterium]
MAESTNKAIDLVKKLVEQIEQSQIKIVEAFLFGSYAKGTYNEWSDIDVALISDDFVGNRFLDLKKIAGATLKTSIDIQPHTFRKNDFNSDNPIVEEILRSGIKIV